MKKTQSAALIFVILVVAAVAIGKSTGTARDDTPTATVESAIPELDIEKRDDIPAAAEVTEPADNTPADTGETARALPKLIDLGSTTCHACVMLKPILAEVERELAGKIEIEIIDVMQNYAAADRYGIRLIPTLIFVDDEGYEVRRQEGPMEKDEIIAQFKKMGVEVD